MTWGELITEALFISGVAGDGQTPSASQIQRGLSYLRTMLSDWSRDGILEPASLQMDAALTGGTNTYTCGSGGTFTRRPLQIYQASIFGGPVGNQYLPIRIGPWAEFMALTLPSAQGQPTTVYYNPTYPLGTIGMYPTPSSSYHLRVFGLFDWVYAELFDEASLPPGYQGAIMDNLALRLCQNYGVPPTDQLVNRARDGIGSIMIQLPQKDAAGNNRYTLGTYGLWNFKTDTPT